MRAHEKHSVEKRYPLRSDLKPGYLKVLHEPLVNRNKIVLPPVQINFMKQFVSALPTHAGCLDYLIFHFLDCHLKKK